MSEAAQRTQHIEKLDQTRLAGQRAQAQIAIVGELLAKAQEDYVSELIMHARKPQTDEAVIVRCALKAASVTEVLEDLTNKVGLGQKAGRQLAEMTQQPEDDV